MTTLIIRAIQGYRLLAAPLLHQFALSPGGCRFVPTCSAYGLAALRQYGLRRGFVFLFYRLARCHTGGGWGYDPLP